MFAFCLNTPLTAHVLAAFILKVSAAHVRTFNKYGTEIVPTDLAKDGPGKLDHAKLLELVGGGSGLPAPKALGLGSDITSLLHPTVAGSFVFWIDSDKTKALGLKDGEEVLVRTQGDSIFLEKIARADLNDFAGMENEKLLTQISARTDNHADGDKPLPGEDKEGVADDEWD